VLNRQINLLFYEYKVDFLFFLYLYRVFRLKWSTFKAGILSVLLAALNSGHSLNLALSDLQVSDMFHLRLAATVRGLLTVVYGKGPLMPQYDLSVTYKYMST